MNVYEPSTWHDIALHPQFKGGEFKPEWYNGDLDQDLALLRKVASRLIMTGDFACSLCVLDDCTMYVRVFESGGAIAHIAAASFEPDYVYYLETIDSRDEQFVATYDELLLFIKETARNAANGDLKEEEYFRGDDVDDACGIMDDDHRS